MKRGLTISPFAMPVVLIALAAILGTSRLCLAAKDDVIENAYQQVLVQFNAGEWDKTLEKALQYDFDVAIPGHGAVATRADLVKYVQTIAAVREHVRKACASDAAAAAKGIDLSDIGLGSGGLFTRGVPGMCRELAQ